MCGILALQNEVLWNLDHLEMKGTLKLTCPYILFQLFNLKGALNVTDIRFIETKKQTEQALYK